MSDTLPQPAPRPKNVHVPPLDDGWRQWIAENRLRDCTPESMEATMVAAGLDRATVAAAIRGMENDPVYKAARKHQQLLRKLESVTGNLQKLWELRPGYGTVERRESVSRDEFLERYVRGCRPLVITGIARDWPAMTRWSPADLKTRFGHLDVEIQAERNKDPNFEANKLAHNRTTNLGAFVDRVLNGGPTNDYYLTANNEVLRRPEFAPLLQDIGTLPDYCDAAALPRVSSFWFGPAGTNTPLHHDTIMLLHTQITGRKRWRLISPLETPRLYNYDNVFSPVDIDRPDVARFPLFSGVQVLETTLEPGDTMFLPLGWWHQVSSLAVSLSFSYTNIDVPNHYTYFTPDIRNW
jgi:ribosomal protein L16 Arg81 hydroxylase